MPTKPRTHRPRKPATRRHQVQPELTTTERGYGGAWQRVRERVLRRDNRLCVNCFGQGRLTIATDVDHVVPKVAGGSDCPSNLQSLCRRCHRRKTAAENRSRRRWRR